MVMVNGHGLWLWLGVTVKGYGYKGLRVMVKGYG